MSFKGFRKYLKRQGKRNSVIDRNIRTIEDFQSFLKRDKTRELLDITEKDIISYVDKIEKEGKSAKGFLYVSTNYFRYLGDQELFSHSAKLREERTSKTRKKFPLKQFLGIDPVVIDKLSSIGIKDVEQILDHGKSNDQRRQLASSLEIPEEKILELVNLSDITRLGHVKRKLSRLYYDAGIRSPFQVAEFEAEELYKYLRTYVVESGWNGMIPNRKDLENNIENARKLLIIVEY